MSTVLPAELKPYRSIQTANVENLSASHEGRIRDKPQTSMTNKDLP